MSERVAVLRLERVAGLGLEWVAEFIGIHTSFETGSGNRVPDVKHALIGTGTAVAE